MMLNAKIRKEIDNIVDRDDFLQMAEKIAKEALKPISDKKTNLDKTQIRNLENIVNSATRFSEISNFVKIQAGKHYKEGKSPNWKKTTKFILEDLKYIDREAQKIAEKTGGEKGEIRLQLCRHWVKIIVANFFYAKKDKDNG